MTKNTSTIVCLTGICQHYLEPGDARALALSKRAERGRSGDRLRRRCGVCADRQPTRTGARARALTCAVGDKRVVRCAHALSASHRRRSARTQDLRHRTGVTLHLFLDAENSRHEVLPLVRASIRRGGLVGALAAAEAVAEAAAEATAEAAVAEAESWAEGGRDQFS
ncbi:hypothetical protein EVAR_77746_1 [Eumeta japonica]|uniref:Uncharacterized protein n=1 Tax=Eumeta variegata TaxID=151549 RepID=A0A4C1TBV1_EUMVA|nr:hypothetical protein EVAR_77746_1 [Eumeta japonica]